MSHAPPANPISIPSLRPEFVGAVVGADDPGYDDARVVIYNDTARPAVIIRAAKDADVARAVDLARTSGLELAVRSGGATPRGAGPDPGGKPPPPPAGGGGGDGLGGAAAAGRGRGVRRRRPPPRGG